MQITGSILQPALTIKATSLGAVMQFASIPNASTGSFTGSVGNMWFNTDTNQLQYTWQSGSVLGTAVWTTAGAMITLRSTLSGAGTTTAALAFGGYCATNSIVAKCTEAYNGSTWTAGGALINAFGAGSGTGTQTAALAFGSGIANTQCYNGTAWSVGGANPSPLRDWGGGAGTSQNSALYFGGTSYPTVYSCTAVYNGSTWTAGGALITARLGLGGSGTTTAALGFGGRTPTIVSCAETYNGSTWSSATAMITARSYLGGTGTSTAALGFGGYCVAISLSCTEIYNGTTWTSKTSMITARHAIAGVGTQNSALAFGATSCAELFTMPLVPLICTRSL